MHHIFVDASPRLAVLSTRHRSVFSPFSFFTASSPFCFTRHKFQLLKLVSRNTFTLLAATLSLLSPAVILHPLMAVVFTLLRPAVIFHPCWRSNLPLPDQRSSSTPAGGQIHPSPHPAVMFHPSPPSRNVPPLPTQRSHSTTHCPAVIFHPYPPSGHIPSLPTSGHIPSLPTERSYSTPTRPAVILLPCSRRKSPLPTRAAVIFHSSYWRSNSPLPSLLVFQGLKRGW